MGIFSNLFSSDSMIEKSTDAIINAGDKLVFTSEEKADMNIKLRELHIETLKAYSPFKIAQRVLAVWYSFLFGLALLVGMGMECFNIYAKYKEGKKAILLDTAPLINIVEAFSLSWIVLTIVAFYFAGGSIESFRSIKK